MIAGNFSILIPTLNEEKDILNCLKRVIENVSDFIDYEILIIDGGSIDNTIKIVKDLKLPNLKIFIEENLSVYQALNYGVRKSSKKYIIRVDSRALIPENYIKQCLEFLNKKKADAVGGLQVQYGETNKQKVIAESISSKLGNGGSKVRLKLNKPIEYNRLYMGCFKKEDLIEVGLYDDSDVVISEDSLMNYKLIKNKKKLVLLPIEVKYPAKETFAKLFKQYFIYGGAQGYVLNNYFSEIEKIFSLRQIIPVVFVITMLLSILTIPYTVMPLLFLLTMYSVSIITAFFLTNLQIKNLPYFFKSICCIHFAWAFGFLVKAIFKKSLNNLYVGKVMKK